MDKKPTTYWEYLRLPEMLDLQGGLEGDEAQLSNDEVMFVVVHQIDELWFKLAIRELVSLRDLFRKNPVPEQSLASAVRGLRRLALLFHQVATHFGLMETMTTRDYLGFRDKLSPASGFQSAQLREVEILLGLADEERVPLGSNQSYLSALKYPDGRESWASQKVASRIEDVPNVHDVIDEWLHRTPIQGSRPEADDDDGAVLAFVESYLDAHRKEVEATITTAIGEARTEEDERLVRERYDAQMASAARFLRAEDVVEEGRTRVRRVRAAATFIESYRELPLLAWPREVLDAVVALEQSFLILRQRHARMVERVIGRRTGTGGSTGVDYLDKTALRYRVFPDVWAVRTILLRREALPPLEAADVYGFVARN